MAEGQPEQLTAEQLAEEVGKVLTSWPLYRVFRYKGKGGHATRRTGMTGETISNYVMLPKTLSLHCSECGHVTRWETDECQVSLGSRDIRERGDLGGVSLHDGMGIRCL